MGKALDLGSVQVSYGGFSTTPALLNAAFASLVLCASFSSLLSGNSNPLLFFLFPYDFLLDLQLRSSNHKIVATGKVNEKKQCCGSENRLQRHT